MATTEVSIIAWARKQTEECAGWVDFYRRVFGKNGEVYRRYPEFSARTEFYKSDEYVALHDMFVRVREKYQTIGPEEETTRVITVRLPKSMHEVLRDEAFELHTSMNKLCISKLAQAPDARFTPRDKDSASRRESQFDVVEPFKPLGYVNPPFRSGFGSLKPRD